MLPDEPQMQGQASDSLLPDAVAAGLQVVVRTLYRLMVRSGPGQAGTHRKTGKFFPRSVLAGGHYPGGARTQSKKCQIFSNLLSKDLPWAIFRRLRKIFPVMGLL
jgi:hypothetical protein